jgi:hypothetical protein
MSRIVTDQELAQEVRAAVNQLNKVIHKAHKAGLSVKLESYTATTYEDIQRGLAWDTEIYGAVITRHQYY